MKHPSHSLSVVAVVVVSAVLGLLAAGTGQVLAADFYVGGDGASDRNPGTASQPFATIQKAAGVAAAGDFVNIRHGIYRETIVPANSGAPGQPITFQPDGDAEVTVSGADLADGGWTVYSGQIYQRALALPLTGYGDQITGNATLLANQVFVGGKMMIEARWPNLAENLNNNIYRAPIKPDKPGTNEMTAATDPKFTNAGEGGLKFRLQPDSPAIDRGAVIPGVTDGHAGTAPDLGAYEFGGPDWVAGCDLSLTPGLIGWWKLDEKSGTAALDSSGRSNHGKLIGGPTWADGRIGGALHFANTDDTKIYVDIPNSPSLENVQEGDWTVTAWVWPDSLPPGTQVTPAYGIFIKQGQHIGLVYDQDGLFKMQHHSAAGYSLAKSATKPPKAWYHVAGVVSKSNGFVKIYVNGKLESAVEFVPGAKAVEFGTRTWKLGIAGPDYTHFREAMNGKVDDVRIYSRALSDAAIAALAAQGDPQSADRNDWPQFRGPSRDGKSPETGLLKVWPEAGPRLSHTISGFGGGFSCPVIAGGRIYITGKVGDDLKIFSPPFSSSTTSCGRL